MLNKLDIGCCSLLAATQRWTQSFHTQRNERGDVPGWVLVAVMTAGLVTAIWLVADDALTSVFDRAMSSISEHS
ncbi:MAG: hypothetical protein Q7L55_06835 [Actinomycetota bacterium]|nr:hypothetical protein [Actinomycetota bacterium]